MRQERTVQASLFDLFADHEIGRELKAMSQWLDEHRELIGLAAEDLRRHGVKETGREGLPAESVLRCALLKQHRQLSYEELAFHLEDSASFRAFARLPLSWTPKKSALHRTISAIRAETWEAINRILLISARQEKVETGKVVRLDSTVTAALMHEPSDSSLLWDAVHVLVGLLKTADAVVGGLEWRNHRRAAKKRARAIEYARDRLKRIRHYRELIALARSTLAYADLAYGERRIRWRPRCGRPSSGAIVRWSSGSSRRPSVAFFMARRSPPTRRSSACSSRTPTSSSRAPATFNMVTSST